MKQILVEYDRTLPLKGQLEEVQREIEAKSWKTVVFHIYSGVLDEELLQSLAGELSGLYPDAPLAGTISAGEIHSARVMDKGVLISALLFESTEVRKVAYDDVRGNETETGRRMRSEIDGQENLVAVELILPGTEFSTRLLFDELSRCNPDVKLFGGYAGGHSMDIGEHFIFDGAGLSDNKIFMLEYIGEDFHVNIDKSVGWQTLGHHFTVTKADGNRLIEIDGKPAVEVYEKYLRIDRNDHFAENTFEFPLIAKVEEDELLRHTITVEPDGSLILAGYVTEGMHIYLCFGNPSLIVEKVNERIENVRRFRPEAILIYSCSVRKSFWEKYVNMEMEPFEKMAPTSGFYTWGEVKRNEETKSVLEYNITMLTIAMREGEPENEEIPPLTINDSVLQGQASLMRRLSTLVSATTLELQNAYRNLEVMNKRLTELSERDALTGLYNRRCFENATNKCLEQTAAEGGEMSLVMMDLDFFKKVNDTFGHAVGDSVLTELARLLEASVAGFPGGMAGRWGGEEFFVLLPNTSREDAAAYAERLRKWVEAYPFAGVNHSITLSLGVLTTNGKEERNLIYKNIDDCLYAAKASGRNRYVQYRQV